MKMSVNRELYDSMVKQLVNSHHSKVVSREKGECIMRYLKGESNEGMNVRYNSPKFRFYVRSKGFEVLKTDIHGLGRVEEHLFQKVVEHRGKRYKTEVEPIVYRRVAFMEDFYDILRQHHNHGDLAKKNNSPIGYKRCLKMIQETYSLIPRSCVQIYCNLCTICQKSKSEFPQHKFPGIDLKPKEDAEESCNSVANDSDNDGIGNAADLSTDLPVHFITKPDKIKKEKVFSSSANNTDVIVHANEIKTPKRAAIRAKSFMELCQLEIIEMDDMDHIYLYLGHFIDVYSNYHILFPLVNKSTAAIVQGLGISVFSYFGIPKTLQSSQGTSFLIPIIDKIHIDWPNRGNCSLGNVSSNRSVHNLITFSSENEVKNIFKTMARENMVNECHISWVKWIPLVQYRLNTQVEELGDPTAYQKVVKQLPRSISICTIHRETDLSKVNSTPEVLETLSSVDKETADITIDADGIVEINSSRIAEAEVTLVSAS